MQEAEDDFDRVMRRIDNALHAMQKKRLSCSTGRIQAFQREVGNGSTVRSIMADTSDSLPAVVPANGNTGD